MKILITVLFLFSIAIGAFLLLRNPTPETSTETKPMAGLKKELANPSESNKPTESFRMSKSKELNFTDDKGTPLFNGKKLLLIPGQVEIEKGVEFQLVTDDNGRWKIELTSKDYAIGDSNNIFDEDNLYPINGESLKELTTIILTKTEK